MKKFYKFLTILFALVFCFTAVSCGEEDPDQGKTPEELVPTAVLLKDSKPNAKIVIPQDAAQKDTLAASEFNEIFSLSTDVRLEVVRDNEIEYDKNDSYIFLGLNKFLKDFNITPSLSELGDQGFIIKNVDKSVVISGASKYGFGTVYGVYEFLARLIDFEQYADDEIYVKPAIDLDLFEIDFKDKPDIPNKLSAGQAYNSNTTFKFRNRMVGMMDDLFIGGMNPYHTSFVFLPPSEYNKKNDENAHPLWYTDAVDQLCWRAHGNETEYNAMLDTLFEIMLARVEAYPALTHIGFSMQDTTTWCKCDACKQIVIDYGANSASCVLLLNDLSDKFAKHFKDNNIDRELDFVFLAYKETASAPATKNADGTFTANIKCNDNVFPFVCTFSTVRSQSITSDVNKAKGAYDDVEAWGTVANRMALWTYSANYNNFMAFYNPFDCFVDDYKYYKTKNPVYHLDEAQGGNYYGTSFTQLSYWLKAKVAWDVDSDVNALTDEYFERYFQDAQVPMRKYFDELRIAMRRAYDLGGFDHYDNTDPLEKRFFPYGTLQKWSGYIKDAYDSIEYLKKIDSELYGKLYKRITIEKCAIDYANIKLYGSEFYSTTEYNAMLDQLIKDCETAKILEFFEGSNADPKTNIDAMRR